MEGEMDVCTPDILAVSAGDDNECRRKHQPADNFHLRCKTVLDKGTGMPVERLLYPQSCSSPNQTTSSGLFKELYCARQLNTRTE